MSNQKEQLLDKMKEHLKIAQSRGFKDKALRLTTQEIEIIIKELSK
ncbi:hypothetical protein ACSW8S_16645 (plasmid) [Clostridium perfringens]